MTFGVVHAEEPAAPPDPICKLAEVNPVTGHVLCLRPLGAPVDPPKADDIAPCKPDSRKDEAWTWGTKC
jgi:hypothetical protein